MDVRPKMSKHGDHKYYSPYQCMLAVSTAPRPLTQTQMTTLDHILKVSKPESAVLMAYEVVDDKTTLLGHVSLRCEISVK